MKRLKLIFFHGDPGQCEVELASILVLAGIWFILPMNTFSGTAWAPFARLVPEWVFGLVHLGIGALKFTGVISGNIRFRKMTSFVMTFVWWSYTAYFAIVAPVGFVIPLCFGFGVASLWVFWRLWHGEATHG